ncbi:MAG: sulfatase-like hydrolase/transferase, partial [Planctomycetes bacterium]|nr:sulfatase-like hydrolase/transferase [Planctomycetota bacterium]
ADNRASAASQTSLAQLFATVCDAVETGTGPRRLIWVHARGMYGPWDAPLELQQSLLDEGDPPPVETIDPPDLILSSADDPDTAFRNSCAYAAQVAVLDACWEGLMETLGDSPRADEWLVMLLGARGFPLGEHRRIGGVDQRLYADQLHVPWLLRFPGGTGRLARTSQLASSLDCLPTLLDWITEGSESDRMSNRRDGRSLLPLATQIQPTDRDVLVFASADGDRAIRTQGWSLRRAADADGENSAAAAEAPRSCDRFAGRKAEYELFVRPDDRWEANDVATLCPDVVEGLARVLHDTTEKIVRGEPLPNESLPKDLTTRE